MAISNTLETPSTPESSSTKPQRRAWWCRGGMHLNILGMAFGLMVVVQVLVTNIQEGSRLTPNKFVALAALSILASVGTGTRTLYGSVGIPLCMASLSLAWTLPPPPFKSANSDLAPLVWIACALAAASVKNSLCSSVCLHRYAAHAAYKPTSEWVKVVLAVLCALGVQGGPLWWASQHRAHHKYCDVPGDPHSPAIDGDERAFSFFMRHVAVNEECCPPHLDCTWMRVFDTFSFLVVWMELLVYWYLWGTPGLFIAHTSGWTGQCIVLWYNVTHHSAHEDGEEKASSCRARNWRCSSTKCVPFWILDRIFYPILYCFSGEAEHHHHHQHPMMAYRGPTDLGYFFFLLPLQKLGLILIPPANVRVTGGPCASSTTRSQRSGTNNNNNKAE